VSYLLSMASIVNEEYTKLRSLGNDHFVKGEFAVAETIYSDILLKFDKDLAIIYTNRSAARLSLGKVDDALEDAQKAIDIDRKWIKAYYRKASALEILKR
jgi:tetratricopeptide (TPR) repeat protein